MKGFTHRWTRRDGTPMSFPDDAVKTTGSLVDRVLLARGFAEDDSREAFRAPTLHQLHAPETLPDIEKAANRIVDALQNDQTIVIYGDYDVDGMTATAILYHLLKAVEPGADLRTYVPHRLDEGYGLHDDAIRALAAEGAQVVVSVDCGITAHGPARVAREVGVDLIVTDHHHPPDEGDALPEAFALVHPALPGSAYPFHDLCGAGVAFKLAWQVATTWSGSQRVGENLRTTLLELLPFVALGAIADVVPLVGENRVLTKFGLQLLPHTKHIGLRALLETTGVLERAIESDRVGFILAPHLNASGRMDHASAAIDLLTTAPEHQARAIASDLVKLNQERRQIQRQIEVEAAQLAEDRGMIDDDQRVLVLHDPRWHPGVIGIVCSRLTEQFCRPSILLQNQDGMCRGSARSIEGYSIIEALDTCAELLESHGGHAMAAGLRLRSTNLDAFIERLSDHAREAIPVEHLTPGLRIDCDAQFDDLTLDTVNQMAALAPFGRGNPRPVIALRGMRVASTPRQIGATARHLSFDFYDATIGREHMLRAIWWNHASFSTSLAPEMTIDLAIEPKLNTWNGRTNVQAIVRDVRASTT